MHTPWPQLELPIVWCPAKPLALPAPPAQGPKVLTGLAAAATLDGYNTGLSAEEEVPGGVERRLSPEAAQHADFLPLELDTVDGAPACVHVALLVWCNPCEGGIHNSICLYARPCAFPSPCCPLGPLLVPNPARPPMLTNPAFTAERRGSVQRVPGHGWSGSAARGHPAPGGGRKPPRTVLP
jgi:hypothetical protein